MKYKSIALIITRRGDFTPTAQREFEDVCAHLLFDQLVCRLFEEENCRQ